MASGKQRKRQQKSRKQASTFRGLPPPPPSEPARSGIGDHFKRQGILTQLGIGLVGVAVLAGIGDLIGYGSVSGASVALPVAVCAAIVGIGFLLAGLIWERDSRAPVARRVLTTIALACVTLGGTAAAGIFLHHNAEVAGPAVVPPAIPFRPYGFVHGDNSGLMAVMRGFNGECLTVSLRDRSGHGGHACVDAFTHTPVDPCYRINTGFFGNAYACYSSPWSESTPFDLMVATKVVLPPNRAEAHLNATRGRPWGIELENGEKCLFSFDPRHEPDPTHPGVYYQGFARGTYLCARDASHLNVLDADGWVEGPIVKKHDGWFVWFFPETSQSKEYLRVTQQRTGPA